ncbi:thiamine pyrophosphate-dependent enzyme [Actinomadura rudentiformis]|uniref:thiamine pyrophosphate-dependent enzyme n=1 Tax=Actinomadura rudentiformis TaxID=359158 RepID=UPI00298FC368|nr:thiamine pyrophosphate-dependent enzyme [Actinomadura rudentiformis]
MATRRSRWSCGTASKRCSGSTAARWSARPSVQVALMLGNGAAGFSLMDAVTLVRHNLPVVMIVGNSGQPQCRHDEALHTLDGAGALVTHPDQTGLALRRAFDSGAPRLVDIATASEIVHPRGTGV